MLQWTQIESSTTRKRHGKLFAIVGWREVLTTSGDVLHWYLTPTGNVKYMLSCSMSMEGVKRRRNTRFVDWEKSLSISDTWMHYNDYMFENIWMQLRERGASNKVIQEIYDECKADNFSKLVLSKYNLGV